MGTNYCIECRKNGKLKGIAANKKICEYCLKKKKDKRDQVVKSIVSAGGLGVAGVALLIGKIKK